MLIRETMFHGHAPSPSRALHSRSTRREIHRVNKISGEHESVANPSMARFVARKRDVALHNCIIDSSASTRERWRGDPSMRCNVSIPPPSDDCRRIIFSDAICTFHPCVHRVEKHDGRIPARVSRPTVPSNPSRENPRQIQPRMEGHGGEDEE